MSRPQKLQPKMHCRKLYWLATTDPGHYTSRLLYVVFLPPPPLSPLFGKTFFQPTNLNNWIGGTTNLQAAKITTCGQKFLSLDLGHRREFPLVFLFGNVQKLIIDAYFLPEFNLLATFKDRSLHGSLPNQPTCLLPVSNSFSSILSESPSVNSDIANSTIPPSCIFHPKISRTRCGQRASSPSQLTEYVQ
ncbi:unnamed protein product [Hymenolepis diminuta]|uniref:Uncharacterized protein n=1 Tax=Hymenolepis diminuta TaxID=6216 RepID=A0A0R3SIP4_HYMDI|nr:unnamed protein product [Hymenolepis diminuta]